MRKERVASIQTVDVGQLKRRGEKALCLIGHAEGRHELGCLDARSDACSPVAGCGLTRPMRKMGRWKLIGVIDLPAAKGQEGQRGRWGSRSAGYGWIIELGTVPPPH
jgi:hypothetical protein